MSDWLAAAVVAHLWQSTLVGGAIWLVTLALRMNRPRVRYWLWVAASAKFLVPFSLLVSLGAQVEWRTALPVTEPAAVYVAERILMRPVTGVVTIAPAGTAQLSARSPWGLVLASVWALGCALVLFWCGRQWLRVRTAVRKSTPLALPPEYGCADLRVSSSPSTRAFEPGVVGVWRPVLLLPEGLLERMPSAQMKTVIAHERCHIRCHDNLAAAVHMLVEALFWFHPLVWWIERQLIDERERACDEAVLASGNEPLDYAEGILAVCRLTIPVPVACVSGITGADLRARIESIFRKELGAPMTLRQRIALAFFGLLLIAAPIFVGVVKIEMPLLAVGQEPGTPIVFEVAAVKRNTSGALAAQIEEDPGGRYTAINAPLRTLILRAYQISENQLVDAPEWTRTERFDINAKLEREPPKVVAGETSERLLALRTLLADRFKLVVHRETREFPMYALVMARADRNPGPMLKSSSIDCSPEATKARVAAVQAGNQMSGVCGTRVTSGLIQFGGRSMSDFARVLSTVRDIGRGVIDRTGLSGTWDFELSFTPDRLPLARDGQEPPVFDPNGPSLPTALQEQLGLKLESIRGPMEVLVVDRVERLDRQD